MGGSETSERVFCTIKKYSLAHVYLSFSSKINLYSKGQPTVYVSRYFHTDNAIYDQYLI